MFGCLRVLFPGQLYQDSLPTATKPPDTILVQVEEQRWMMEAQLKGASNFGCPLSRSSLHGYESSKHFETNIVRKHIVQKKGGRSKPREPNKRGIHFWMPSPPLLRMLFSVRRCTRNCVWGACFPTPHQILPDPCRSPRRNSPSWNDARAS